MLSCAFNHHSFSTDVTWSSWGGAQSRDSVQTSLLPGSLSTRHIDRLDFNNTFTSRIILSVSRVGLPMHTRHFHFSSYQFQSRVPSGYKTTGTGSWSDRNTFVTPDFTRCAKIVPFYGYLINYFSFMMIIGTYPSLLCCCDDKLSFAITRTW